MLNLPPRNGYLPIIKMISIQAKHMAAEATTLRTSWTIPGQIITFSLSRSFLPDFPWIALLSEQAKKYKLWTNFQVPESIYGQSPDIPRIVVEREDWKIVIMFSIQKNVMFARPEKDDQKYLHTAQSWVSKVFIGGTSSKEPRAAVCLLGDSGELRVWFSEEWGARFGFIFI